MIIGVHGGSSEGVINTTEGRFQDIQLTIVGYSYDTVTVMTSVLTYSEYTASGYRLEDNFNPDMIPPTAADSMLL